ncbi:lipopolysaccharide biosynthesis protein [Lysobacter koreensis]|uniref:Lipopolysaccharide biosynthesis protein n=1 Tax=Lysobacter koreensis TaxID=266122 RepID=A0ABW2YKA0_9GAMM
MNTSTDTTLAEEPPAAATPPRSSGISKHYLRYSGATVVMMATGLVSFPILTRLLDNTEYGILGYYETWVLMIFAVIKLGGQHAVLRFYPFGGDAARLTHFATNLVFLPLTVSAVLWTVGIAVFAGVSWWRGIAHSPVLWCALLAIPLMVFISQVQMTLRASERSGLLTTTKVTARWVELALVLTAVVLIQRSALAVYAGRVITMLLLVGFYLHWVRRHLQFSRQSLDPGAYRESLIYGLPLVANEIVGAALASIDRLMLKHMLDDYAAVGIYTIGYALAMQLGVLVNGPFWDAFTPALNRAYTEHGEARVREMKARVLLPATYACVGVAVGIWIAGSDVLQMLSGSAKAASGEVFAWVGTMYAVMLLLDLSGYGLLLRKRTGMVLLLTVLALSINVALNLVWIPRFGYMGAVYSTVLAYLVFGISRCLVCPPGMLQLPDRRTLLVSLGAAALFLLMVDVCGMAEIQSHLTRAALAGVLWLACYLLPVLALDARLRGLILERWPRARG